MLTQNKKLNPVSDKVYHDLLTMQKAKRGDIWLLLTILLPLSITPVTINYGGAKSSLLILQWVLFTVDLTHLRVYLNISIFFIDIFGLQFPFPFVSGYGNPLYMLFVLFQLIALVVAIIFRIKQKFDSQHGKIVNSGVVGLSAFIILFFEVLKFPLSRYQVIDIYQTYQNLNWTTTGINVQDPIITTLMTTINNLFGQSNVYATNGMIPILPLPIITNILKLIHFTAIYPITFYLEILTYPLGLLFPVLWMIQERRAFPSAFSSWISNFLRAFVIILFTIISLFPVIWLVLISINYNDVLKSANIIWPFNGNSVSIGFTLNAWKAFDNFKFYTNNLTVPFFNFTISKGIIAFSYIGISAISLFIGVFFVFKRKWISNFFENWLNSQFKETIEELSWIAMIILELILILVLRFAIVSMRDTITFNKTNNSSPVQILKFFIDYLVINIGSTLFTALIPLIIILVVLLSFGSAIVSKRTYWFLLPKGKIFEKLFSIFSLIAYCYLVFSVIIINILSQGYGDIYYSAFNSFSNIIWFDISFLLFSILFLSMLFKFKHKWFGWIEAQLYEDGIGFTVTLIFFGIGIFFAVLADQGMDWVYIQSNTGMVYAVGNWFFITFFICTIVAIVSIIIASFSGYALSRFNFQGRKLMGSMILSTQIFPGVLLLLPVFMILSALGLTKSLLGLGLAYSITSLPFITFLLKGFFDAIPKDLEEQAMIDGCSRFQAYHKIVLPLIVPGITSTFVFSFLALYTEYLFALTVYNPTDRSQYTISLAMLNIFQADITQRGVYYNEMAVFAILVTLPVLLIFSYLQKYFVQGLISGSTKG